MKRKLDDEIVTFDLCVIGSSTKCAVPKIDLTKDWLLGKIEEITSKTDHRLVPSMQFISIWVSFQQSPCFIFVFRMETISCGRHFKFLTIWTLRRTQVFVSEGSSLECALKSFHMRRRVILLKKKS